MRTCSTREEDAPDENRIKLMRLSEPRARVLVVEDDIIASEIAAAYLREGGLHAVEARNAASALACFAAQPIDLALVDVNLPDGLGFDLVATLRAQRDMAVIYVTSRDASDDKMRGFETGGDDYIVKPVDVRELLARVRAVLRRAGRPARQDESVFTFCGWTLDLVRRELVDAQGALVRLTRGEFDLFAALFRAGTTALHREFLVEVLASSEASTKARTVDVLISRIRRKLAQASQPSPRIITRTGEGYLLQIPDA
jgi:two-component system torCAD operon response regulator TorR